jgi:hypothetical protein
VRREIKVVAFLETTVATGLEWVFGRAWICPGILRETLQSLPGPAQRLLFFQHDEAEKTPGRVIDDWICTVVVIAVRL